MPFKTLEDKRRYERKYHRTHKMLNGVRIDWSMYRQIKRKAIKDNTSIAEATRTLIEWGMEADVNP